MISTLTKLLRLISSLFCRSCSLCCLFCFFFCKFLRIFFKLLPSFFCQLFSCNSLSFAFFLIFNFLNLSLHRLLLYLQGDHLVLDFLYFEVPLHVDVLLHDLILLELSLFLLLSSLLLDLFLAEFGSFTSVLNLLVLVLLDERSLLQSLFITLLHFPECHDLVASILLLGKFYFHLDLKMMFLSLLVLVSNLIRSLFIEFVDFLVLLHYSCKVIHKSLLLKTFFAMHSILQIFYSFIVCLSSITINVLPVLRPLLGILNVALNRVQ